MTEVNRKPSALQDPPFNIHATKTQLSRLVDEVAAGEEIIIAKSGKPVARLGPLVGQRQLIRTWSG